MDRMTDGEHPRILLGVCGGIAAYKTASLTSALVQRGALVDVIMTAEAERFVGALTFASLTARPVYTVALGRARTHSARSFGSRGAVFLIAPATANTIAKLAAGIADDLVTTCALAARIPVLIAPAMNSAMYEDPATQANLRALRERGYDIVDPERGFLAERERGIGRLADEAAAAGAARTAASPQRESCAASASP